MAELWDAKKGDWIINLNHDCFSRRTALRVDRLSEKNVFCNMINRHGRVIAEVMVRKRDGRARYYKDYYRLATAAEVEAFDRCQECRSIGAELSEILRTQLDNNFLPQAVSAEELAEIKRGAAIIRAVRPNWTSAGVKR